MGKNILKNKKREKKDGGRKENLGLLLGQRKIAGALFEAGENRLAGEWRWV